MLTEVVNLSLLAAILLVILLLFSRLEAFRIANRYPGRRIKFGDYAAGLGVVLGNLLMFLVVLPAALWSLFFGRGRR